MARYFSVTEYYVEKNGYDPDGEWVNGEVLMEFSEICIALVEKPGYETLATFNTYADAEQALNDYSGDNEVYLSF